MSAKNDSITASKLRSILDETLSKLVKGQITIDQAQAVAGMGREIVRSVNVQLAISKATETEVHETARQFNA